MNKNCLKCGEQIYADARVSHESVCKSKPCGHGLPSCENELCIEYGKQREEKCNNCEDLRNGSIIKVGENGECVSCKRIISFTSKERYEDLETKLLKHFDYTWSSENPRFRTFQNDLMLFKHSVRKDAFKKGKHAEFERIVRIIAEKKTILYSEDPEKHKINVIRYNTIEEILAALALDNKSDE